MRFLQDKDIRRALFWTSALAGFSLALVFIGRVFFDIDTNSLARVLSPVSESVWALPATIFVFCAAAFIGTPQSALIAAAMLTFGPMQGGIFAWLATMCSASIGFWTGRFAGAERLSRFGGAALLRMSGAVARNAFIASFVVRLVPAGAFIVINVAAGVSRMAFPLFFAGTAFGIVPKILLIGLIVKGVISGLSGSWTAALFALLAGAVILLSVVVRKHLKAQPHLDEANFPDK